MPTVALRYFNVYGPRQDPESQYAAVIPRFAVACLTGARPVIYGDGEQSRDFTFIDDVVRANLLAARMPEAARGRVLNVGGGAEPTSINRLLHLIGEITETSPEPIREPARERTSAAARPTSRPRARRSATRRRWASRRGFTTPSTGSARGSDRPA